MLVIPHTPPCVNNKLQVYDAAIYRELDHLLSRVLIGEQGNDVNSKDLVSSFDRVGRYSCSYLGACNVAWVHSIDVCHSEREYATR